MCPFIGEKKLYPDWQVEFFRGVALEVWRRITTPEQTHAEADFLHSVFRAEYSSHLLDIPCGNGRHSIALAKRGHRVTGVDLSEEFIAEARAASGTLSANWIAADLRHIDWREEFDGAFCFGNSFGFLDPEEAQEFLVAIARALKPGSRFVVETGMAAESILPAMQQSRWFQLGDIYMLSANHYHPREGRLDIQYTFIREGRVETRPTSSYVLTVSEIWRMHAAAGLEPVELHGSIDREPYRMGSPRLIIVSVKQ